MAKKAAAAAAVLEPPTSRVTLVEIPTGDLMPWENLNPRTHFDEAQLEELAESIRQSGVIEPIIVHRRAGDTWSKGLILAGERRWRAAVRAGLATMPCLVREYTETEALEVAIVENAQRSDLSPVEEARGFRKWLAAEPGRTQQQLAERIGFRQTTVSNRIRLLELPPEILDLVEGGTVPIGAARDLLLPFTHLAEAPRAAFFAKVAKDLAALARQAPPTTEQVHAVVGSVGLSLSRNLEPGGYGPDEVLFDPKEHRDCGCGGPSFRWWPHNRNAVRARCFNPTWWDAANARVRAAQAAAERKREAKLKAGASAGLVEMKSDEFDRKFKYGQYESLRLQKDTSGYGRPILLDPAELAEARLVRVTDGYNAGLKCVDMDAVKRAKSAATKERNQLLKERRAARAEKYRADAAKVDVEPWMLGEILAQRPQSDTLLDVAREMEIDLGKHGEVYGSLKKMPDDEATLLFKVLALRSRAGELGWTDPLEKAVDAELVRKYSPGLKASEARATNTTAAPAPEKKGRAGKAKKVPAAEVETPRQQLHLRFEHVREALAEVEAAGGATSLATMPDAEGNPLSTLARRVMSLQDFIAEHGAVPLHAATAPGGLFYSIDHEKLLAKAEALLQPAGVAHA